MRAFDQVSCPNIHKVLAGQVLSILRTDCLSADQHFLLLFLENAGTDLESYRFDKASGWRQAVEVLWQVADSLATAETKAEFEVCCSRPCVSAQLTWLAPSIAICMKARFFFPIPKRANFERRLSISACLAQSPRRRQSSSGRGSLRMYSMGKGSSGMFTGQ